MIPNKIVGHSWMKDNRILLCDEFKNIYLLSSDGSQCQQLHKSNLDKPFLDKFLIQSFKSGFIISDESSNLTVFTYFGYDEDGRAKILIFFF